MVWILRRNPISSDKKSGVFYFMGGCRANMMGKEKIALVSCRVFVLRELTSIFCISYESGGLCQRFITFLEESQSRN